MPSTDPDVHEFPHEGPINAEVRVVVLMTLPPP